MFIILATANAADELVEFPLAIRENFFLIEILLAILSECRLQLINFNTQLSVAAFFLLQGLLLRFIAFAQLVDAEGCQLNTEFFVFGFEFEVFLGSLSLFLEAVEVVVVVLLIL